MRADVNLIRTTLLSGVDGNDRCYGKTIAACGNGGEWELAMDILHEIEDNRVSCGAVSALKILREYSCSETSEYMGVVASTRITAVVIQLANPMWSLLAAATFAVCDALRKMSISGMRCTTLWTLLCSSTRNMPVDQGQRMSSEYDRLS